jgi:hypothetical protein
VIILWWDESESDGVSGDNPDDFNHTIGEIIISPLAHENENGLPYASSINYSHSSDLRTMQEIFHVKATAGRRRFWVMQPTRRTCPICLSPAPSQRQP